MKRFAILLASVLLVLVAGCTAKQSSQSAPAASPSTEAAATPAATTSVAFTDISGYDGAQAITDLATLGVLDSTSGTFKPNDPITRADFVRWLVKAQNAIIKEPEYHIHLAQGTKATFVDVPSTNPDFGSIQGLANAGYVIGVDPTHFAPDKSLTREQMIFIKACVDERSDIKTTGGAVDVVRGKYSDYSKIVPMYVGAIYEDESAMTTGTFARVYGSTKTFDPQQPVTRGEAAVALSAMRGEWPRTAADALGRTPAPQ